MVRSSPDAFRPSDLLEDRFPNEVRLLRAFVEKSVLPTGDSRTRLRKAFRDTGMFDALNQERENEGEESYRAVADVPWLEIGISVEKRLRHEAQVKQAMDENRATWLSELVRRDAEEAVESEAIRVEGPEFAFFEPMSRGPEDKRKWFKHVPYKYLPENKTSFRKGGAPMEIKPEEYQRLKSL